MRKHTGQHTRRQPVRIRRRSPRQLAVAVSLFLSQDDSRERPAPWDSGVWSPIRLLRPESVGSIPACPTNAKAMCGAWLAGKPVPGRLYPVNLHGTAPLRHPGETGPRRAESRYQRTWLVHCIHSRDASHYKDGLECTARLERIQAQERENRRINGAAAEKAAATIWELSERELKIISELG